MITSFKIENFKGFCELELPLSRITLLGGGNNVGKTSVLEALFTFFSRYDPQILTRLLALRGVNSLPPSPEMMWGAVFHDFDMTRPLSLQVTRDGKQESVTFEYDPTYLPETISVPQAANGLSGNALLTATAPLSAATLKFRYQAEDKSDQIMRVSLGAGQLHIAAENLQVLVYPVAFFGSSVALNVNDLASRFGQLDIIGKQGRVVEFLQIIEPRLRSLSVIPTGNAPLIYGDIGLSRKIPIAYMGEGIARLLDYIVNMATNANGLMLIDEIENGLHHSVMEKVWEAIGRAAREFNCQIIATTHSFELLEDALIGLGESYREDFAFIRLDRRGDCVRPVRFDYEMLETATEMNMEIR